MKKATRPNPDELLKGIQKQATAARRGKLKIFFGMCPGVGKTFSMLRAAHEKQKSGMTVAVGVVETHDREETKEILKGLIIIPKRKVEYRGTVLEELDIDQVLSEKPDLVLIDELAHTNAPGSRHPKRYQDIEEILNHGINVFSTLNVQHIESRAELVENITQIPMRETVPDSILELADQFEVIDLSPEELLKRLKDGKVYLGERADLAAKNFFKEEHLVALRELALRYTAEKVDDELKDQMILKQIAGPWQTHEKLLVAVSHSPYSGRLIRATKRKAQSQNASWIALHLEGNEPLTAEDHDMLVKNLSLVRELGGEIVTLTSMNLSRALKKVTEEQNVTQIVIGRPDKRLLDYFRGGTVLEQLVRETSGIDIHVLRQARNPKYRGVKIPLPKFETSFHSYFGALGFMCVTALASHLASPLLGYRAVGFIFLLGMLGVSLTSRPGPTFLAAGFSAIVWNFFFIPPLYTFVINATEDLMMVLAYFVVAGVLGHFMTQIRTRERDLEARQRRSQVLYELAREYSGAKDPTEIALMTIKSIEKLFQAKVRILSKDSTGQLGRVTIESPYVGLPEKEFAVAQWAYMNRKKAGWGTDTLNSSPCLCLPLVGKDECLGVLLYYPHTQKALSLIEENLLDQIIRNAVVAFERLLFESEARTAKLLEASERLHQTLLNSVSHELRTPLTSIIGASSALQDPKTSENRETRSTLTTELVESADRLNRLVENLLDMSRINSGALTLKRDLFEIGDFLRQTYRRLKHVTKSRRLIFKESSGELFIRGDEKLLEHAVSNIIVNACLYSPSATTIEIETLKKGDQVQIIIRDEGKGLPETNIEKLFEKFYRLPGTPTGGTGLGLSIVKGIVEAHQGSVYAQNRSDRSGAMFVIELPCLATPDLPTERVTP